MSQISQPFVNAGTIYINGMIPAYVSNTTFTVTAGACRNSTNINDIIVDSLTTVDMSTNGINGLDFGTFAASTLYTIYAVGDSNQANPAGYVVSTNQSVVGVMPAGYDMQLMIGHIKTDGSIHILPFDYVGNGLVRTMLYRTAVAVLTGGAATSFTDVDCSAYAPARKSNLHLNVNLTPNVAGDECDLRINGNSGVANVFLTGVVAAVAQKMQAQVMCDASAIFEYKLQSASDAVTIYLAGYDEILGL